MEIEDGGGRRTRNLDHTTVTAAQNHTFVKFKTVAAAILDLGCFDFVAVADGDIFVKLSAHRYCHVAINGTFYFGVQFHIAAADILDFVFRTVRRTHVGGDFYKIWHADRE